MGSLQADTLAGPARFVTSPFELAALGAGVLAGLLLLLFIYRRKPYILHWTCSWTLLSTSLLLTSRSVGDDLAARLMMGLAQTLSIAAALLLVLSASAFRRHGHLSSKLLLTLLPLVIWFGLAPLALGRRAVLIPGYVVSAATLGLGAAIFLSLFRKFRMTGAGLISGTLLVLGASHAWIAITTLRAPSAVDVTLGVLTWNATLYLGEALGMYLLIAEDMTYELRMINRQLSTAQAELEALAVTDELTGCYNRRYFHQIIVRELKRHHRYGLPLSLLFIDIDRFKEVNDKLGHDTGDRVLQLVADLLIGQVREPDYVFRWGGDEFVVLLSCGREHAERKARDIKAEFVRLTAQMGLPRYLGLSVGCGEASAALSDPSSLLQEADEEMYRDKFGGRSMHHA